MAGILYLCATPIGNLEDMTFRAVKILREVDLIAAEDTRHTRKLLAHFEIHTPLIRYDEFSKVRQGEKILQELLAGKNIACVSDAGLPAISDPGADLVKLAINSGVKVCPIPGANAALSALICSGLSTEKFSFVGFLPKSKKNRDEILEKISRREETIIFYESPHRILKTLAELENFFGGERNMVIARELTKIHEEFLRGKISGMKNFFDEPKGEFVLVVEGYKGENDIPETSTQDFFDVYKNFLRAGIDKKAAIRETAKNLNLSRRDVYNKIVEREKMEDDFDDYNG